MITHKWLNTLEHTVVGTPYYILYSRVIDVIPVDILRNQFDSTSGIYIVGRPHHVIEAECLIMFEIDKIEAKVKRKKFLTNVGVKKAKYRSEWIAKIITENILSRKPIQFGSDISNQSEKFLRKEYIDNSNLKSFKPFK